MTLWLMGFAGACGSGAADTSAALQMGEPDPVVEPDPAVEAGATEEDAGDPGRDVDAGRPIPEAGKDTSPPPDAGSDAAPDARPPSDAGRDGRADAAPDAPPPDAGGCSTTVPVVEILADTNRNGKIDPLDPSERTNKTTWDKTRGAIFLANIDDDSQRCAKSGSDVDLAACNDAQDDVVNGADDELDLAPLQVSAWACAPDGATATVAVNAEADKKVRFFVKTGSTYKLFQHGKDALTAAELRQGVTLALEGRDIVRDEDVWDGYVNVTLTVSTPAGDSQSDTVRMRVAPLVTMHHLQFPDQLYAASFRGDTESQAFIADLKAATTAAGVTLRELTMIDSRTPIDDQWTQDIIEAGYATMPSEKGVHGMHVVMRSANVYSPNDSKNPLRPSGKVVFTRLRGKDVAGVAQYDVRHPGRMDTLDSFGNLETIPPYSHNGESYPLGRVIRGSTATYHPDTTVLKMLESQKVQPPVYVDTSWLLVGHIDETISFVKGPTARGWMVLANDATLAKTMLTSEKTKGNGNVTMFQGLEFIDGRNNYYPAEISISDVLADPDLMAASALGAIEVDNQLQILKAETGLTDAEIIPVPFLHTSIDGSLVAYQPGTVNGISLGDSIWAAPKPHGPVIGGKDIMVTQLETELGKIGITVRWVENWYLYHILDGEIHCGSTAIRRIPTDVKWWESGR